MGDDESYTTATWSDTRAAPRREAPMAHGIKMARRGGAKMEWRALRGQAPRSAQPPDRRMAPLSTNPKRQLDALFTPAVMSAQRASSQHASRPRRSTCASTACRLEQGVRAAAPPKPALDDRGGKTRPRSGSADVDASASLHRSDANGQPEASEAVILFCGNDMLFG